VKQWRTLLCDVVPQVAQKTRRLFSQSRVSVTLFPYRQGHMSSLLEMRGAKDCIVSDKIQNQSEARSHLDSRSARHEYDKTSLGPRTKLSIDSSFWPSGESAQSTDFTSSQILSQRDTIRSWIVRHEMYEFPDTSDTKA
jgi:hypothetical protein